MNGVKSSVIQVQPITAAVHLTHQLHPIRLAQRLMAQDQLILDQPIAGHLQAQGQHMALAIQGLHMEQAIAAAQQQQPVLSIALAGQAPH